MVGSVSLALALAAGLGARDAAADLLAGYRLRLLLRPGDGIRAGSLTGVIREVGWLHVILEAGDGEVILPNRRLLTREIRRIPRPQARHEPAAPAS